MFEFVATVIKWLSENETTTASLQALITSAAFLIGAWWTYKKFIKNRGKYPRAEVFHEIKSVDYDERKRLLHVEVKLQNAGDILLPLSEVRTSIYQIKPKPVGLNFTDMLLSSENEFDWLRIGGSSKSISWLDSKQKAEIEPRETQSFHFEFILESYVEIIKVYSYVPNITKRGMDIGWDRTTMFNFIS